MESFNGKLRDECLNRERFDTLLEAPVLDVEFAGVLLDGPGREGMAKAVGVAAGYVGGASAAAEQLLEAVGLEPHAGPQPAGPGDGP